MTATVPRTAEQDARRRSTVAWVVGLAFVGLVFDGYDLVQQWSSYGWNVFTIDDGNDAGPSLEAGDVAVEQRLYGDAVGIVAGHGDPAICAWA